MPQQAGKRDVVPTFGTCGALFDWVLCARAEWRRRTRLYLRHSVRRKNGRSHTYWRLVRSVRRGGKAVQETIAQWGHCARHQKAVRMRKVKAAK